MSRVIWTPPRPVTHPALALPCHYCGAGIGSGCRKNGSATSGEPHYERRKAAKDIGFTWAPGVEPERPPDEQLPLLLAVIDLPA